MYEIKVGDILQIQSEEHFIHTYGSNFKNTYDRGWNDAMTDWIGKEVEVLRVVDTKAVVTLPNIYCRSFCFNIVDLVVPKSLIEKPQMEFKIKKKIVQEI